MKNILMLLLILMAGLEALARDKSPWGRFKLLTHEDYVHLSDHEKNQYQIKIMELIVELESQYQQDTRTYGFSRDRLEKYFQIVRKLEDALLPRAHADENSSDKRWSDIANDFKILSTRSKVDDGNCIFAGWISRVQNNMCLHPRAPYLQGSDEQRAYLRNDKKGCSPTQKQGSYIECNPIIFGYKNKANGTLFCVSTLNKAENSSYSCMQEALKTRSQNEGIDKPEDRLNYLRDRLGRSSDVFNSIFGFNMKACVCPTAPNGSFNTNYQDYIRPREENSNHSKNKYQACFSFMNMMSRTLEKCDDSNNPLPQEQREIFNIFLSEASPTNPSQAHNLYKTFLLDKFKEGSAKAAYNNLCTASSTPPVAPTAAASSCEATCSKTPPEAGVQGKSKSNQTNSFHCTVTKISPGGAAAEVTDFTITKIDNIPANPPTESQSLRLEVTYKSNDREETLTCTGNYQSSSTSASTGAYTCNATCTRNERATGNKNTCAVTLKKGETPVDDATVKDLQTLSDKPTSLTVEYKEQNEKKTTDCSATWSNPTPPTTETSNSYTCSGKCRMENNVGVCTVDSLKNKASPPVTITPIGGEFKNVVALARKASYKFKPSHSAADTTIECEVTWPQSNPLPSQMGQPQMPGPGFIRRGSDLGASGIR
jgi:hypothetical protein